MSSTAANLLDVLWPRPPLFASTALRNGALVVGGVCVLTLSAKIQIPFYPVPMTLQTLVILVLGMSYGMKLAGATVLGYLLAGAAGAPIFAAGGGLAYFSGPTGGYLAGFLLAALAMGYLGDRGWGRSALSMIMPMTLGTVLLFLPGVAWLAYLFGIEAAITTGLVKFIPSSIAKIALAIPMVPGLWRIAQKNPSVSRYARGQCGQDSKVKLMRLLLCRSAMSVLGGEWSSSGDWQFVIGATVAAFIIGMSRGGFAGGVAFVGVLIMAQFTDPVTAAAFILPLLCFIDPLSTYVYRRRVNWQSIRELIPVALAGIAIGAAVFSLINADMIRLLVCALAVYLVADRLMSHKVRPRTHHWLAGTALGAVTGFTSFLIHAGHPSLSAYLLPKRMPRELFVGTCAVLYTTINYVKLAPYALLGILDLSLLSAAAVFFPVTLVGFAAGRWLVKRISDHRFYQVMYVSIALMSLKLAYDGLAGLGLWQS